ncbi:hypothetical protein [Hymenobacter negativus]|uniref:DUF5117 domain-containing protein n=1 Tax=Hymenobacter negativus TaxID=2795026 RepID=A0ABS3Q8R3_9BACT|nr:hypothetical protein [Hymenobacter negativus]MBO2007592.1 hypothetical protein [Hymenobacter negativus]
MNFTRILRSSTALGACACALLLTACEKKDAAEVSPQAPAVTTPDVRVQDGRLVFASDLAWMKTVSQLANYNAAELAAWQGKFPGFEALPAAATEAALLDKPDGEHPVDRYFLALLNRDGLYQVGQQVHIFSHNVLYSLTNPDEATIRSVRQAIATGHATASPTLKISVFSEHPPQQLRGEPKEGGSTANKTLAGLDYVDDNVQYQWYQGNNFYFKYRTRFGVRSTYNYNGQTAAEVYLTNTLLYSKTSVTWWRQAGDNANKTFSTMSLHWDGNGQLPVPYAIGVYGPTSADWTVAGKSSSDNTEMYLSCGIITADHIDNVTLSGTVSNSVNWNTSQSNFRYLNYSATNLNP